MSNSQSQIKIPSLGAGSTDFQASYSGDTNYASSSGTLVVTVNPMPTNTSVTSSNPSVVQGTSVTFTAQINPAQMDIAPLTLYASVQFTANGIPLGTGRSITNNQAQVTTSFPTPGTVQIQATYSGNQDYASSVGTFTETVTLPPDFSITASGTTSQTINAGQTATFTNAIVVSALNGSSPQVSLSCSLPVSATSTTCMVNPNVLPSGNGTANVIVSTMARGLMPPSLPMGRFYLRPQRVPLFLVTLLLATVLLRFACTRDQRLAWAVPLVVMVVFLILQTVGCGGGGYSSPPPTGTPAGTYTITVIGMSANTTHTTTLTVTVM